MRSTRVESLEDRMDQLETRMGAMVRALQGLEQLGPQLGKAIAGMETRILRAIKEVAEEAENEEEEDDADAGAKGHGKEDKGGDNAENEGSGDAMVE